ncbi:MAG TPA: bifunctional glycosyltransferase family 2 protein/CDP-glycerol:glycerophosphate glycerophosphotransferase [Micromonosporaceae bacterium]
MISVIVPVHNVAGYLRACLDSILNQSFHDLELIAVDDRSPDHCPAILDEYASADPRLRVIHLDTNVGLGRARNIGLDRATGTYVWFVDSDDWLPAGALHAVAAKVQADNPDVLLVDHTRVDWLGQHRPSDGRRLLSTWSPVPAFTLADEPRLLNLFTVAWNKVIRRDFLTRTGLRFDVGWYEDLPFTYPVLVAAERIATVGRVCYHYRRRRQDAITQTRSRRHFEVFDQWQRVFARLDELGPRAAPYRAAIFQRMVWHLFVVQSRDERLPAQARREFFAEMSRFYARFRPAEEPPLSRLDQVRRRLLAANAYLTFRGLRRARLGVRRARRTVRRLRRHTRSGIRVARRVTATATGRAWYAVQRRLPIEADLAVYAAYWYRGFACNPAAIYQKAAELVPWVRGVWIVEPDAVAKMPPGVPFVVHRSLRYYRTLARARWLVNNVNFPDFVVKRPGSVHVQTHHGTPVKVMGLDQAQFPVGAQGLDFAALMRRCDRWDYSVSANAHTTEVWSRAYPCAYQHLEYGYPRNDRLVVAEPAQVAAVRADLAVPDGTTVVLYAPTHREYLAGPPNLIELDEFADALGEDTLVLARGHYFYTSRTARFHPRVRDVSDHPRVEDLLLAADVLVTDYSSIMFDYAVLDRPIAIYAPDWDAYRRTRGVTFDLIAEAPGVVATTAADLVDAFRTGAIRDDAAAKARAQFRARFCALEDGRAAERVVRRVFLDAPVEPE